MACTVVTPDTAPEIKLSAIKARGATVIKVTSVFSFARVKICYRFRIPSGGRSSSPTNALRPPKEVFSSTQERKIQF